jgi:hypothetical protein
VALTPSSANPWIAVAMGICGDVTQRDVDPMRYVDATGTSKNVGGRKVYVVVAT